MTSYLLCFLLIHYIIVVPYMEVAKDEKEGDMSG